MAGLVPAIHVLLKAQEVQEGSPRRKTWMPRKMGPHRAAGCLMRGHDGAQMIRSHRKHYRPNTNSMEAVDVFFSSGEYGMTFCDCREPTSTATYCLPLTA